MFDIFNKCLWKDRVYISNPLPLPLETPMGSRINKEESEDQVVQPIMGNHDRVLCMIAIVREILYF